MPARIQSRVLAGPIPAGAAPDTGQFAYQPIEAEAQAVRTINAAVPFASGELPLAEPFRLGGGFEDMERAIDCLAAASYYEAGRGAQDQRAVAQVVLNRVRHPAFPDTVCGVVFQGSERVTGCQFTFTCDGSLNRRTPSAEAWQEARLVAGEMLFGRVEPSVGQATHYHTDWVMPAWSREMDKVAAVRTHLFFRWRGSQGEPRIFSATHAGREANVRALARLSPVHAAAPELAEIANLHSPAVLTSPGTQLFAVPPSPSPPPSRPLQETLPDEPSAPGPGVFLVTLSASAGPDSFLRLAQQKCAGLDQCRLIGWTDPARQAHALPIPGSSVDAISFTFMRRDNSQVSRAQWNCTEFPREDPGQCLRRGA
ncbi:cell wall hydrolase [Altericroceibacterium xinjiangense]|uniref:cell wall hydrolase n=1 Tax=Altericroceibacterium xinjiangense TaxID=762261 RepID=UPI000F7E5572|nr:cell wall hydrolase [Altericroceibacterium xinjiangense]